MDKDPTPDPEPDPDPTPAPDPDPTPDPEPEPKAKSPDPDPTPDPEPDPEPKPWYDGIEDEKVLKFAKTHPSPADLARFALETRQKLSNAVVKPNKNASEEDVAAFRKQMGIPDEPSKYKVVYSSDLPEKFQPTEDSPTLDYFKEVAHKADLSNDQLQAIVDGYYEMVVQEDAAAEKYLEKAQEKSKEQLDREWGQDAARNREVAVRAAEFFGGPEFVELLETGVLGGTLLGDHPAFLRAFSKIGLQMDEANPLLGKTSEEISSLEALHQQKTKEMNEAFDQGDRATAMRLQAERAKISEQIAGNVPIIGRDGRVA